MTLNDEKVQRVWEKANLVAHHDSNVWRKDQCGAWIHRAAFGKNASDSQYGWQARHVKSNGSDDLSNLIPLQWKTMLPPLKSINRPNF